MVPASTTTNSSQACCDFLWTGVWGGRHPGSPAMRPKVKVAPSSSWQRWVVERKEWGGAEYCVRPQPPTSPSVPQPPCQHRPPLLPSILTKLTVLCKSPHVSPGLKGRSFRGLQNWSQARCSQPKPVLGRGGRRVRCRRQMFLFSSGDEGRRARSVQMGGSGEGAWGAVSRIDADGVSRMQFWWQTILIKCSVNPSLHTSVSGAF